MKKISIHFAFVIILVVYFSSCSKDNTSPVQGTTPVPDPAGTITATLDPNSIVIYNELAVDAPWTPCSGCYTFDNIRLRMAMSTSSLNSSFGTDVRRVGPYEDWVNGYSLPRGELANLGKVDGLGNVTTKPSSGYTPQGTIEKGNGYVIRSKKYFVDTPGAPYSYYRFFVVDWIINTNNGVNGAKIKIQGPF